MNLTIRAKENFGDLEVAFYSDVDENIYMTREQIGRSLGYTNPNDAIRFIHNRNKERFDKFSVSFKLNGTDGKKYNTILYNEKGIYEILRKSDQPKADAFYDFVYDFLIQLRKSKKTSLLDFISNTPSQWTKTFPDEFMRQVMKLYGYEYDRSKGTPSFVGHFINKYIYNTLDGRMSKALKEARKAYVESKGISPERVDEVAFLHQFLAQDGKEALRTHITEVKRLASGASHIEHFDVLFNRAFCHPNQMELYLKAA